MNHLNKLLQGIEVEWKTLGEVATVGTGNSNRQDEYENGEYPFYVRSQNILRANHFQFDETAIIVPGEGSIGDIFHFIQGKYALHQRAYRIKITNTTLEPKFLYYYMRNSFKTYIMSKSVGATATSIRKPMIESFPIPIPSLSVQKEIVRILDTFTELTAELTAELTMRKKQYTYYRDKLLTFEDGQVEWKTLGDKEYFIVANSGRKPVKASERITGNFPYYGANNIQDYVEGYTHDGEFVLIAEDGTQSLENYSIQWATGKFWANNHVHVVQGTELISNRFLFHYLKIVNFIPFLSGGDRAKLTKGKLVDLPIPIPPLPVQHEIVRILDKFDTLTNSITEGLPREIELRQKQYEHYRDLLLTFSKKDVEV
jgi:type I restriction enzyme S subunit